MTRLPSQTQVDPRVAPALGADDIPEGIPQDVWNAAAFPAEVALGANLDFEETGMTTNVQAVIARAIHAEREAQRERDAKIADEYCATWSRPTPEHSASIRAGAGMEIAAAIRTPA